MMKLAFTMLTLGAIASAQTPMPQKIAALPPTLEVREFSGDFTQWGDTGALGKGGLQKEFRWSTARKEATIARFEVSIFPFPNPSTYQAAASDFSNPVPVPPASGVPGFFTIDFAPLLQKTFGTGAPKEAATFYVRLVTYNSQNQPLSPVSRGVKLEYAPPAAGTNLDRSMTLRLKSARAVKQTSGAGADDIGITIIGASPTSTSGHAKQLFGHLAENIPDNWFIVPSHVLWTYSGIAFKPDVIVVAAVVENDESSSGFTVWGVNNAGAATGALVAQLGRQTCSGGDSCLGGPQLLTVTPADWNKVVVGGQVVTKRLRFEGDGGVYELTFELSRK